MPREIWTPAWPILLHLENMTPEDVRNIKMADKPKADALLSPIHDAKASSDKIHHQKYDTTLDFYNHVWNLKKISSDQRIGT